MKHFSTFQVYPKIPETLSFLDQLSRNVWWCWQPTAIDLFRRIDPHLWEKAKRNPLTFLAMVPGRIFKRLAKDESYLAQLAQVKALYMADLEKTPATESPDFKANEVIAYLSMEFGLHESIPLFAGGLGILAGDHLKAASMYGLPLVGMGLMYSEGYFQQYLNQDGLQQEAYPQVDLYHLPLTRVRDENKAPLKIFVPGPEGDDEMEAALWCIQVGRISLYLLDTNLPENPPQVRQITTRLYGGGSWQRLVQEVLLGIGGIRALKAMGLTPKVCHMNEGHSAFSSLERLSQLVKHDGFSLETALQIVPRTTVFTTHTPVAAGNDEFPADMVKPYLERYTQLLGTDLLTILSKGQHAGTDGNSPFSMSVFGFRMAQFSNGVSRLHGEVARRMWAHLWPRRPENQVPVTHITNGVHIPTWVAPANGKLYENRVGPNWQKAFQAPERTDRIDDIFDDELWRTHADCRSRLIRNCRLLLEAQLKRRNASQKERERAKSVLDMDTFTIGFARRFATYKRAYLLFQDPERLKRILCHNEKPVQIVIAGKAHPKDGEGKGLIRQIIKFAESEDVLGRVVFLENYDMHIARLLTQGADIWLNTPRRPFEACGTSGMKAAMNGVLNVSILDGWWAEAYQPGAGWAIGDGRIYEDAGYQDAVESQDLYNLLEEEVIPCFYNRISGNVPYDWVRRMKDSIKMSLSQFGSQRMVNDYYQKFYAPAARQYDQLMADGAATARDLTEKYQRYRTHWNEVQIGQPVRTGNGGFQVGDEIELTVEVVLGPFSPDEVVVELFHGHLHAGDIVQDGHYETMNVLEPLGDGKYRYGCQITCYAAGRFGYTARIMPQGDDWLRSTPGLIEWT